MKRKLLFVASFMMLSMYVNAQQEVGSLTFQPKAGLNIATYTDAEDTKVRFGFAGGAELEYQMAKKFSMATGVLYSMQGLRTDVSTGFGSANVTFKTDYINIPIIANVYVAKGLAIKFGIQPGFNVKASCKANSELGGSESVSLAKIGAIVNTFDFSIPVGLSYESKNYVLDARFNIGVTRVFDNEGVDSRNRVFQFTVGRKFSLK